MNTVPVAAALSMLFAIGLSQCAKADGLFEQTYGEFDMNPCDEPPKTLEQITAQVDNPGEAISIYRLHVALYETNCGPIPEQQPLYAQMGMTDAELLRAVFNGHRVPPATRHVAPIPIPATGWMVLLSIAALVFAGSGRHKT